ncbi:MAG: hypothetical protein Q8938_01630 [Bacteroidota bacterium]|nr:hypothetical protein [Bacteroidota bacterium]
MNYWLLTTEYPPFHGGGISTYCYFTARMFAGRGDEVYVFVPDEKVRDYRIEVDEPGLSVIRFNSNRNNPGDALGYTARLSYAFADIVGKIISEKARRT